MPMYLGHQTSDLSDANLTLLAQLGVEQVAVHSPRTVARDDGTWRVDGLRELHDHLARFGLGLGALALDVEAVWPALFASAPEAEALLDRVVQNIQAAGE